MHLVGENCFWATCPAGHAAHARAAQPLSWRTTQGTHVLSSSGPPERPWKVLRAAHARYVPGSQARHSRELPRIEAPLHMDASVQVVWEVSGARQGCWKRVLGGGKATRHVSARTK
jgi:hypothetical protein